jgi:hypothetical protein
VKGRHEKGSFAITTPTPSSAVQIPLPANAARQQGPAREFLSWAATHQQEHRLHAAELAQITRHHEANPSGNAVHQLQAWAVRQAHARHLHDSAMAQLRHH